MGIHGLMKLLSEEAPGAIKEIDFTSLTGRKVAIDASMAMYQFLVAVRAGGQGQQMNLTNAEGEVTSHIQGMFNRTIKMMESGIKPVYVFDGKPPQLKGDELAKRTAKRVKAEADLAAAKEQGASDDVDRFNRRLVKVGRSHNEDCKNLLRLMGIPVFDAPCEAEAQCAELAKKGKVYATATEDMDALTFRTPKLLRKLTYSQSGGKGKDGKAREKQPVIEIDCEKVLVEMKLTYEQFVDLCILCGCDYSSTIKGIGPKTALSLIREHKCIEGVLKALRSSKKKWEIPEDWKERRVSKKAQAAAAAEKAQRKAEAEAALEVQQQKSIDALSPGPKSVVPSADAAGIAGVGAAGGAAGMGTEHENGGGNATSASAAMLVEAEGLEPETEVVGKSSQAAVAGAGAGEGAGEGEGEDDGGDIDDVAVAEEEEEEEAEEDPEILDLLSEDGDGEAGGGGAADAEEEPEAALEIDADDLEIIPPLFVQARGLFIRADVTPAEDIVLEWKPPNETALAAFLVDEMQFDAKRVANAIKRLKDAQAKKTQGRMDSFFQVVAPAGGAAGAGAGGAGAKRKAEEQKGKGAKAGAKPGAKPGVFAKKR